MNANPAVLSRTEFVAGLAVKIALGVLYGFIFLNYYGGDDTWKHHVYSLKETQLLLSNPRLFFINEYTPAHALAEGTDTIHILSLYLNDLQHALFIKSLAILNLLTNGNYYINVAFFNLLVFCGHYWLFIAFTQRFPEQRKAFYIGCFFYLPAVFWLSGLRIDGLLFFFLALLINRMLRPPSGRGIVLMMIAFIGVLICRIEVALLLAPAIIAYQWSNRSPRKLYPYLFVYTLLLLVFVASPVWMGGGGLTAMIAGKQHQFLALTGTRFELNRLSADPVSYFTILPQAFANTFLRPAVWEAKGMLQWLAAGEILLFWIFVVFVIWRRAADWKRRIRDPFIVFLIIFALTLYLSIGLMVPFPGAIIRYKACALLVLINCGLSISKPKYT
jgi:hypothetical protein